MTTLRDLKVASKLFAGFGVVCLLLAVVVAVGISRLGSSQANLHGLSTSGVASVQYVGDVRASFLQMRLDITSAALPSTPEQTAKQLDAMAGADGVYDEAWKAYQASSPNARAEDRDEVEELLAQYRTSRETLVAAATNKDIDAYVAERDSTTAPIAKEITAQLGVLRDAEAQAAADLGEQGSSDYHTAVTLLLVIGAAALAIATAVAIAVARSIAGPLAKTLTVVRGLAEGRLDQRVAITTKDEVGQLASALDATMERLSATIRAIAGGATTLATSSEELTTVATQLSSGAEEA
ncbi:HAMP domain-containing protein, partial [Kineococcus sp. T13]|uniref:Tar ligand binding domain-containing protein n=1 Tax=Kineococcus vitellinus TaxID=2696565 RepID=UPI001412152C